MSLLTNYRSRIKSLLAADDIEPTIALAVPIALALIAGHLRKLSLLDIIRCEQGLILER